MIRPGGHGHIYGGGERGEEIVIEEGTPRGGGDERFHLGTQTDVAGACFGQVRAALLGWELQGGIEDLADSLPLPGLQAVGWELLLHLGQGYHILH
jgi:hypothetical protein